MYSLVDAETDDDKDDDGKKPEKQAPAFTLPLKDRSISAGSPARFDVRVRGKPEPDVKWHKDGAESPSDRHPNMKVVQEGDLHSLLVTEGTPRDAGEYKCTATNSEGRASCSAQLFVEGEVFFFADGSLSG